MSSVERSQEREEGNTMEMNAGSCSGLNKYSHHRFHVFECLAHREWYHMGMALLG